MEGIYNIPGSEPITHLAVWYYSPGLVEDVVIGIKKGKEDQWDCSKDSGINAQHTRVSSRSYSVEHCYEFRCGLLPDYIDLKKCVTWYIANCSGRS